MFNTNIVATSVRIYLLSCLFLRNVLVIKLLQNESNYSDAIISKYYSIRGLQKLLKTFTGQKMVDFLCPKYSKYCRFCITFRKRFAQITWNIVNKLIYIWIMAQSIYLLWKTLISALSVPVHRYFHFLLFRVVCLLWNVCTLFAVEKARK